MKQRPILAMNAFDERESAEKRSALLQRRLSNVGAASVLFYREPIEMVAAHGVWMQAADGRRYLDFYNNVPSVGHCHPRVVQALTQQAGTLNINTRYLNPLVEQYLEALKLTLPDSLSNVALTCTGSEANDLAMRVAMVATGENGFIVTESAYHGNTLAVTDISPAALKRGTLPEHVVTVPAPGRAAYGDDIAGGFCRAVERAAALLTERGQGVAALICDSVFASDGVFTSPAGFLAPAVAHVQQQGGLYIADEVQPGFARTGLNFWGYEQHGVTPDIVTMGKPMGNGYPMAGMAVTPECLAVFCEQVGYFNTFGGSPVAAAAGLAVLDVIREEGLQKNAAHVGAHLLEKLQNLAGAEHGIAEVRGAGLFIGVEISADGDQARTGMQRASHIINALRDRLVLIGAAGRYGNVLKVRPPLCLSIDEADHFVEALQDSLRAS